MPCVFYFIFCYNVRVTVDGVLLVYPIVNEVALYHCCWGAIFFRVWQNMTLSYLLALFKSARNWLVQYCNSGGLGLMRKVIGTSCWRSTATRLRLLWAPTSASDNTLRHPEQEISAPKHLNFVIWEGHKTSDKDWLLAKVSKTPSTYEFCCLNVWSYLCTNYPPQVS